MTVAGDLPDGVTNFGPGNLGAAFQYNVSLASGQTRDLGIGVIVIPEPAPLMLMGLAGGISLALSCRCRPALSPSMRWRSR
jgi:hypothetical protein